MAFDRNIFATRLRKCRESFALSIPQVSEGTTINTGDITAYESALVDPKGDHILILADFFRCDYRYFIEPAFPDTFANTSILFRAFTEELDKGDRLAVQECLLLSENESFLQQELKKTIHRFTFTPQGTYFKKHGKEAAVELRRFLGYNANELGRDIFVDFRRIGIHIFRRRLNNPNISGLFIHHPTVGKCVIVNFDEDIFRQRFTAAHEAGHAILDSESTYNVSLEKDGYDLKEVRANTFASFFLIPEDFAKRLPDPQKWSQAEIKKWALALKMSTHALAIGLKQHDLISDQQFENIRRVRVDREDKIDPELPDSISPAKRTAKLHAMERGMSEYYVGLALEAFKLGGISRGRLSEMLLCDARELAPLAEIFGCTLTHGD